MIFHIFLLTVTFLASLFTALTIGAVLGAVAHMVVTNLRDRKKGKQ